MGNHLVSVTVRRVQLWTPLVWQHRKVKGAEPLFQWERLFQTRPCLFKTAALNMLSRNKGNIRHKASSRGLNQGSNKSRSNNTRKGMHRSNMDYLNSSSLAEPQGAGKVS